MTRDHFTVHGCDPEARLRISMDLPPTFQKCGAGHLPKAQTTFGRSHIAALDKGVVDAVCRIKAQEQPNIKATHRIFLENREPEKQQEHSDIQKNHNLNAETVYQLPRFFMLANRYRKLLLRELWIDMAKENALQPLMVKFAYTKYRHWDGTLRWFETHLSKGTLEKLNAFIRSAIGKARRYVSRTANPTDMVLLALDILRTTLIMQDNHEFLIVNDNSKMVIFLEVRYDANK